MPPPIKLPHKYSQSEIDRDRERDERDERDDIRNKQHERDHERDASMLKYDRDDDLDRDSSPTSPAEQQSSAHYSSNKRKRKNTSSLCDSSMTSTYNFSATERQSDSGMVSLNLFVY